jgi:hypothetical protein
LHFAIEAETVFWGLVGVIRTNCDGLRNSNVTPILNPGKDPRGPKSYRPISLLSTVSKLFERLILRRLKCHINAYGIYRNEQFEFWEGHSATYQLLRAVKHIKSGLRTKISTGLLFLDVEKAFDCVWKGVLLHKMLNFSFPIIWIKIIMSFLSGRFFLWRCLELDQWSMTNLLETLMVLYCHPHCSTYSRVIS